MAYPATRVLTATAHIRCPLPGIRQRPVAAMTARVADRNAVDRSEIDTGGGPS